MKTYINNILILLTVTVGPFMLGLFVVHFLHFIVGKL